jgi:hypothetical protein
VLVGVETTAPIGVKLGIGKVGREVAVGGKASVPSKIPVESALSTTILAANTERKGIIARTNLFMKSCFYR